MASSVGPLVKDLQSQTQNFHVLTDFKFHSDTCKVTMLN